MPFDIRTYEVAKEDRFRNGCASCKYIFSADIEGKRHDFFVHPCEKTVDVFSKVNGGTEKCVGFEKGKNTPMEDSNRKGKEYYAEAFHEWERRQNGSKV